MTLDSVRNGEFSPWLVQTDRLAGRVLKQEHAARRTQAQRLADLHSAAWGKGLTTVATRHRGSSCRVRGRLALLPQEPREQVVLKVGTCLSQFRFRFDKLKDDLGFARSNLSKTPANAPLQRRGRSPTIQESIYWTSKAGNRLSILGNRVPARIEP